MNNRSVKKAFVGVTLTCFTGVVVAAGCPAVVDSIWETGVSGAGASISAAVTAMTNAVAATKVANLERVLSSLSVLTAQIAGSANVSAQANVNAKQASAGVAAEISTYKAMSKTMLDYGPSTGQGYNPCDELTRSQNLATALGEADNSMQEKVLQEVDAAPGRVVADQGAVLKARLTADKGLYCTASEAAAGLCTTPGAEAGKDTSASNFFTTAQGGTADSDAKSALLNNIFGLPYAALPKAAASTPSGIAYQDEKRSADAVNSVAEASLKSIQSWTESRASTTGGTDTQSVIDALHSKVDTYAGGTNYDAWSQSLATQSERGLTIMLAKMQALDLTQEYMEYQSREREEAIVAARLALRAQQMPTTDAVAEASIARTKVTQ